MKFKILLICAIVVLSVHVQGYVCLAEEVSGSGNAAALEVPVLCPTKNQAARKSYNNGVNLEHEGNINEAIKEYRNAIALDANYCDAMDNLGRLLRRQGKLDEAIYWYKRSIDILPGNQTAHMNLGVAYRLQGKKDGAIAEYQTLLKMNPRDPEGYYGLGGIYYTFKDFSAAAEQFRKAEQLYSEMNSPLLSDAQYMLGIVYYQMKDYGKSIDYLERVYTSKQNDPYINYCLGQAHLEKGDMDQARKYLRRAQELGAKIPPEILRKAQI